MTDLRTQQDGSVRTAKQAYGEHHAEMVRRVALLMSAMDRHQKRFQANEKNWGFVGDIERANELLAESLHSMGNEEFTQK